jgi:hypothetical protein
MLNPVIYKIHYFSERAKSLFFSFSSISHFKNYCIYMMEIRIRYLGIISLYYSNIIYIKEVSSKNILSWKATPSK